MTRHRSSASKSRSNRGSREPLTEQQEQQKKDRGWYCKEHDIKYLCDTCGYDSSKQKDMKYYFVSG